MLHIKSVDTDDHRVDFVYLNDGRVLAVTNDQVSLYKSLDDFHEARPDVVPTIDLTDDGAVPMSHEDLAIATVHAKIELYDTFIDLGGEYIRTLMYGCEGYGNMPYAVLQKRYDEAMEALQTKERANK